MGAPLNLIDKKFGRLLVVSKSKKRDSSGNVYWNCVCDCGRNHEAMGASLKKSDVKSCGCLFLEVAAAKGRAKKTHGKTESRAYKSWSGMKDRCLNTNNKKYHRYGGRGISVCERWLNSFENFYADMGDPAEGMTLDRIEVNGNYEPGNCRWATMLTQQNNRSDNVIIHGITMAQYCRENNLNQDKVQQRLKRGYSIEKAIQP